MREPSASVDTVLESLRVGLSRKIVKEHANTVHAACNLLVGCLVCLVCQRGRYCIGWWRREGLLQLILRPEQRIC